MKIRTLYCCEYCHTDYANEDDAINCERSHRQSLTITDARYLGFNVDHCSFPAKIKVSSSETGEEYWYARKSKHITEEENKNGTNN